MPVFAFLLLIIAAPALAFTAERGTFEHGGHERIHYFFAPADAGPQTPLVIALHGMGGNAKELRFGIGLTEALAEIGFAVVYPQGLRLPEGSRHWNAGFDFVAVDDLGYLAALARHLITQNGLSTDRTVVFGISMGGFMAYHMACHGRLTLSSIVVVAGSMHPDDLERCPGRGKASLLHIHGARDALIPYDGGQHWALEDLDQVPVPQVIEAWVHAQRAVVSPPLVDHARVHPARYLDALGRETQFLTLPDFGHDWPSETTAGYRALDDVAGFLARHRLPERRFAQGGWE
ncbi:MAG: PHB depolymerase family esterase [Pseudomonadota bacterium]